MAAAGIAVLIYMHPWSNGYDPGLPHRRRRFNSGRMLKNWKIIDGRRKPRPTLVVRRSGGNWTRAWEYETPPASGTRERSSRYHELFPDNDNDDEPATMSECSMFLVQHTVDDEFVSSLMTPQRLIDYINMDDCHGENYEIFDCMSEFGKVKPLRYKGWQPGCLIEVVDEAGKVVLRGYGEDH